jgi:hypothetical protein
MVTFHQRKKRMLMMSTSIIMQRYYDVLLFMEPTITVIYHIGYRTVMISNRGDKKGNRKSAFMMYITLLRVTATLLF